MPERQKVWCTHCTYTEGFVGDTCKCCLAVYQTAPVDWKTVLSTAVEEAQVKYAKPLRRLDPPASTRLFKVLPG